MPNTNKKENEKKDVNKNVEEVKGELTYENKVIQKIIGFSLENISSLSRRSAPIPRRLPFFVTAIR